MKDELKRMQRLLKSKCSDEEMDTDMNEGMRSSREAFQNIALHFLRRINHENLADSLQSSKNILQLHFNGWYVRKEDNEKKETNIQYKDVL